MIKTMWIALAAATLTGCTTGSDVKVSSPYAEPIKVELTGDRDFEPIRVTQSGGRIDFDFKSTYKAPAKQQFRVVRSDSKLETFDGYNFKADFHHYAKLLTVEYKSLDSVTRVKYYNNPISWTSD